MRVAKATYVGKDQQVTQVLALPARRDNPHGRGGGGWRDVSVGAAATLIWPVVTLKNAPSGSQVFLVFKISQSPDFYVKYPDFQMLTIDS